MYIHILDLFVNNTNSHLYYNLPVTLIVTVFVFETDIKQHKQHLTTINDKYILFLNIDIQ